MARITRSEKYWISSQREILRLQHNRDLKCSDTPLKRGMLALIRRAGCVSLKAADTQGCGAVKTYNCFNSWSKQKNTHRRANTGWSNFIFSTKSDLIYRLYSAQEHVLKWSDTGVPEQVFHMVTYLIHEPAGSEGSVCVCVFEWMC